MMHRCLFLLASLAIIGCSNARNAEEQWTKLNDYTRPVCFMGKHDQAGVFHSNYAGFVAAVKLVHKSGNITCNRLLSPEYSYFGCYKYPRMGKYSLNVFVTNSDNQIQFPTTSGMSFSPLFKAGMWYALDGVDSKSKEVVLPGSFCRPYYVNKGQVLKVWYGEDLLDKWEANNVGRVCVDVYGYFI